MNFKRTLIANGEFLWKSSMNNREKMCIQWVHQTASVLLPDEHQRCVCHKPGDDRDNSNIGESKSNIKATGTATGARQSAKLSDIVRCVPKEQPQQQQQKLQRLRHNSNRQARDNGHATGASQVNGQ
ncbi:GM26917 [Drosophila sechellia]|uniref:GM26917 n=1 Tax=Drosophila sechellia TaxID=7238 RepID=B4IHX1_DROSE|nr:GM26917 [Drosophila sechellia]